MVEDFMGARAGDFSLAFLSRIYIYIYIYCLRTLTTSLFALSNIKS